MKLKSLLTTCAAALGFAVPVLAADLTEIPAGGVITLAEDSTLTVASDVSVATLGVQGAYTLTVNAGAGKITATTLDIGDGATVQLPSGTTLAGDTATALAASAVTGSGVIGYTAVMPDALACWADSGNWTGTVWIQGVTGEAADNMSIAALGNSASTVRFSGVQGHFAKAQQQCAFAVELENGAYAYGLNIDNGYSCNPSGAWSYVMFPELKGRGTLLCNGAGGALLIVTTKWGDFWGTLSMANKTIWFGYGAPPEDSSDYTEQTVSGGVGVAEGKGIAWNTAWTLLKFTGKGTIYMAAPWDATTEFGRYVGDAALWNGTVELAAATNTGTGSIAVYPGRMGNANSKVALNGLTTGESGKGYYFDGSGATFNTEIVLKGDVELADGYSGEGSAQTIAKLSGTGAFKALSNTNGIVYINIGNIDDYEGTLSASAGKNAIAVQNVNLAAEPAADMFLVSVDESNPNVSVKALSYNGEAVTATTVTKSGTEGYGVYINIIQRNVYWVGGARGNWSEPGNWKLADGTALSAYPQDSTANAGDNVIFTNDVALTVDVKAPVTKVTLDADVTVTTTDAFADNNYNKVYFFFETLEGEGTLTLSGAVVAGINSSRPFKIYTPVCIAAGTSNAFACSTYENHLYGDLSGAGYVKVGNGNYGGLCLHGNNAEFAGEFDSSQTTRCNTSFYYGNASSSKAVWKLRGNDYSINQYSVIRDSGTYCFGALLDGSLLQTAYTRPTLEVGARDDVPSKADLRGRGTDSKNNDYYFNITKVGTNVFTVVDGNSSYLANYGNLLIKGGVLEFPCVPKYASHVTFAGTGATLRPTAAGLDFSALVNDSSSAICIDDNGLSATWATALAASNVGGLTKKGAGTLTLTAAPLYAGPTVVEAGTLVVPAGTRLESLSGGGTLVADLSGAAGTGVLFSVGNIVEGATYEVRNAPSGMTTMETANGVVCYVGDAATYRWVGPTEIPSAEEGGESTFDSNWTTLSNWSVAGATPGTPPTAIDAVQFGSGAAVVVDAAASALSIEADGALTITANYNLEVTDAIAVDGVLTKWGFAAVSAPGGIVADSFALNTGAVTTTSDGGTAEIVLDAGNTSAYAVDDTATYYGYGARYLVDGDGTLVLSGHGQIVANGDLAVDVAEGATSSFTGFISGDMSLTKTGKGTLALFGNNTFSGDVAIEAGTLKLNSPIDLDGVRYDFDASSDASYFTYDGNGTLRWQDAAHPENASAFAWNDSTNPEFVENDSTIFNGKKVLYSSSFRMIEPAVQQSNGNPKTAFFVVQNTGSATPNIAGDRGDERGNIRTRNGGRYMAGFGTGGSTSWNANGIWGNGQLAAQDDNGGYAIGNNPTVLTFVNDCADIFKCWFDTRSVRQMYFGGSGAQAWAEYLSYNRELSFDEKAAVEQYLMAKWGIAGEYNALPKTAAVTMNAGATLDLGGQTVRVASFAGAGIVQNGTLVTDDGSVTATGSLAIPAIDGMTYAIAPSGGEVVLTLDGTATGITIDAGNVTKPVKVVTSMDSGIEFITPRGWSEPEYANGQYRIGNWPFVIKLR